MTTYRVSVSLPSTYRSVSCPAPPRPPVPTPEDLRESFRCACLVKYHQARLEGFDHLPALRETSRLLKLSGHPWYHFDLVSKEINQALGRRPGRSRSSREDQP